VVLGGIILAGAAAKATCRISLRRSIAHNVRKFRHRPPAKQQSTKRVDAIRKDLPAGHLYFEARGWGLRIEDVIP
jgi:hypothetical protein